MKRVLIVLLILSVSVALFAHSPLTFEERVKAQEAIERVYYNHRIWPKENPQPKPPFEKMVTKEQIETKVTDYLKKCSALDQFWQRPIEPKQLQAEMERMAKGTKDPATLNELFAALNNDPYLIAECLARPVLADRLVHNWYANDERFHKEVREKAEEAMKVLTPENFCGYPEGQYSKVTYRMEIEGREEMEEQNPEDNAIGLGENEFARMLAEIPNEEKISAIRENNDSFVIVHTIAKNEDGIEVENLSFRKTGVDEWLNKQELPIELPETVSANLFLPPMPEGACTEGWDNGVLDDDIIPLGRYSHTAVWTGFEMIIWGGCIRTSPYSSNTGAKYLPSTDSWTPTSTGIGCPSGRRYHTAVWTGSIMIVWGGYGDGVDNLDVNTGRRYNPSTDTWTATSTGANCPSIRCRHTAVWTGTEMVIWGGIEYHWGETSPIFNTGGKYSPLNDSWTATSTGSGVPDAREFHTAVWTGSSIIVWGGDSGSLLNSGGIYFIPYAPSGLSNNAASDMGCPDSGVTISWTIPSNWGDGSTGTRTFDILRDGTPITTGLSESTLAYTDTTGENGVSYFYQVRANNGCGLSTTTTGMSAADNVSASPDEVLNFNDVYSWDAVSGADGYKLYRGIKAELTNLRTSTADGCLRYEGTATSYDLSGDDPSEATGNLYWYLVTAYTGACEGSAGEGTGFTRNLSSSANCP